MKTNREVHEEAAGMGPAPQFFTFNHIDPDSCYRDELDDTDYCPLCGCIVDGGYCPCEEACEQASCQH